MNDKLLIIDNDPEWAVNVKHFLEKNKFAVGLFNSVNNALDELTKTNTKATYVILNLALRDQSPVDVIEKLVTHSPKTILIGLIGDQDLLKNSGVTVKQLQTLGVVQFIRRTTEFDSILLLCSMDEKRPKAIDSKQSEDYVPPPACEIEKDDSEFIKISLNDFFTQKSALFSLHIRIDQNKYIKILNSGEKYDHQLLEHYKKQRDVKFVYLAKEDRLEYLKLCNDVTAKLFTLKKASTAAKVNLTKFTVDRFITDAATHGIQPESIELGKEVCHNVFKLINANSNLKAVLDEMEKIDPATIDHAFLVTFLANMIAVKFEWNSKLTTEIISFGCMLHDIGKTKLPYEIAVKKPLDMTEMELYAYKKHPQLGIEILKDSKALNPTTAQVILQHHEFVDGTGFPQGLSGKAVLVHAQIVNFSDMLANIMIDRQISSIDAFKLLIKEMPNLSKKIQPKVLESFLAICTNKELKRAS